jgi:hypothetical protein
LFDISARRSADRSDIAVSKGSKMAGGSFLSFLQGPINASLISRRQTGSQNRENYEINQSLLRSTVDRFGIRKGFHL